MGWRRLACWLVVPALVACGSGSGSDGEGGGSGDGGDPPELDDPRIGELAELQCEQIEACGCVGQLAVDACVPERVGNWQARLSAGFERGLTFDSACLDTILAEMDAAGCDTPVQGYEPICARFCAPYHGDVPLGEACTAHDPLVSDCAQGLSCDDGECKLPCTGVVGVREGEPCRNSEDDIFDDCGAEQYCDFNPDVCAPLGQLGELCFDRECVDTARCDLDTETCVPKSVEGEPCLGSCAPGMHCFGGDGPAVCRPYSGEGGSCADGRICDPRLACMPGNDYTCEPMPGEGGYCGAPGLCAPDLLCDAMSQTCVAEPAAGEPCVFLNDCGDDRWCDDSLGMPGVCQDLIPDGMPCSGAEQCESGSCPAGACATPGGLGDDCSVSRVCDVGLVCNGATCQTTRTRAPAACVYEGW